MDKLNFILAQPLKFYGTEKTLLVRFPNSNKSERLSFSPTLTHKACGDENALAVTWEYIVVLSAVMLSHIENVLENLFARTASLRIRGERI